MPRGTAGTIGISQLSQAFCIGFGPDFKLSSHLVQNHHHLIRNIASPPHQRNIGFLPCLACISLYASFFQPLLVTVFCRAASIGTLLCMKKTRPLQWEAHRALPSNPHHLRRAGLRAKLAQPSGLPCSGVSPARQAEPPQVFTQEHLLPWATGSLGRQDSSMAGTADLRPTSSRHLRQTPKHHPLPLSNPELFQGETAPLAADRLGTGKAFTISGLCSAGAILWNMAGGWEHGT